MNMSPQRLAIRANLCASLSRLEDERYELLDTQFAAGNHAEHQGESEAIKTALAALTTAITALNIAKDQ